MAFVHGSNSHVALAEYDLTAYLQAVRVGTSVATHDITVLGQGSMNRHRGLFDGVASLSGLFDATYDELIEGWMGSAAGQPFTLTIGGPALGDSVRIGTLKQASYQASTPVGGMVTAEVEWEADGGIWKGWNLHPLAAETGAGPESSVDNGVDWVGVNQGGLAVIHLTAHTALTSLDAKVQDSTNDADWADLATFTQLTDVGSEAVEVALGTQVDRYLRANWTLVGTSATFLISFARWTHSA